MRLSKYITKGDWEWWHGAATLALGCRGEELKLIILDYTVSTKHETGPTHPSHQAKYQPTKKGPQ